MTSPVDLSSLGVYSQEDTKDTAYARLLILGPPKVGKSTCIACTAPKPFIINCDGDSALKYPAKLKAEFNAFDVTSQATLKKSREIAKRLVESGQASTVVLDSLSVLADNLLDELKLKFEGFELYRELLDEMMKTVKYMMRLQCHVIFISHMVRGYDEEGIVPLIAGKTAQKIPAIVHDIVRFDFVDGRKPYERMFLIGPQKDWTYAGRNVKRTTMIEATVPKMFEELGIAL